VESNVRVFLVEPGALDPDLLRNLGPHTLQHRFLAEVSEVLFEDRNEEKGIRSCSGRTRHGDKVTRRYGHAHGPGTVETVEFEAAAV